MESPTYGNGSGTGSGPSSVQQRRNEILAKKAKLAELKRQRDARQREFAASRQSVGEAEVGSLALCGRRDDC